MGGGEGRYRMTLIIVTEKLFPVKECFLYCCSSVCKTEWDGMIERSPYFLFDKESCGLYSLCVVKPLAARGFTTTWAQVQLHVMWAIILMRLSVAGVGALKSALEKVQDYPVCDHSAEAL
ncbi:unnamed protein product [Sphagnum balticum]